MSENLRKIERLFAALLSDDPRVARAVGRAYLPLVKEVVEDKSSTSDLLTTVIATADALVEVGYLLADEVAEEGFRALAAENSAALNSDEDDKVDLSATYTVAGNAMSVRFFEDGELFGGANVVMLDGVDEHEVAVQVSALMEVSADNVVREAA